MKRVCRRRWMTVRNRIERQRTTRAHWQASGKGGAIAAGRWPSTAAGLDMLKSGGNAADAAAAALLTLCITDYGWYCIGAEAPLMIYDAQCQETKVLCGLGTAPKSEAAMDWYGRNGIPDDGNIKAVPVPGAPDLIFTLLREYGSKSFADVVRPALRLLASGTEPWHSALARTYRALVQREQDTAGSRYRKLQAARDRFYKGDIADRLVAYYEGHGGFLTKRDLADHVTWVEDPVSVNYRDYTVQKCDSWTQGPFLLQALRLLEQYELKKMGHLSADYIHVLTEALKLGFADRDAHYGDPLFSDIPMEALLSDSYTKIRQKLIDPTVASKLVRPGDPWRMQALSGPGSLEPWPGGTTTCVVADRWGNVIAVTPSGNPPYHVCDDLGIAHGNRLRSLNTTPEHPNCIEPGKRPRITLTPTLVLKDGKPALAISVAGGDLQDQTTLNLLLDHIEFGMLPKDAVCAPRFSTRHHEDSFRSNPDRKQTIGPLGSLHVNPLINAQVRAQLSDRGHEVQIAPRPIARPVMLYLDSKTNVVHAAGDPKGEKTAAAIT